MEERSPSSHFKKNGYSCYANLYTSNVDVFHRLKPWCSMQSMKITYEKHNLLFFNKNRLYGNNLDDIATTTNKNATEKGE